jgi:hypothetical protein
MRFGLLGLVSVVLATGCTFDLGESQFCDREVDIRGQVSDTDVYQEDYKVQSVWFNSSLEEQALSDLDREMMEQMGLDDQEQADVERFLYFTKNYDLRNLYIEQLSETEFGALGAKIGKDLGIYFFDLEDHEVQPGTPIAVFDVSDVEVPRDMGDTEALGEVLRQLIDEMRDNGRPDAIVAFAPDRSEESEAESIFIEMLSPNARFATSGTATFRDVEDLSGLPVSTLVYPTEDIDNISFSADVVFGEGEHVVVQTECVLTSVSGSAD